MCIYTYIFLTGSLVNKKLQHAATVMLFSLKHKHDIRERHLQHFFRIIGMCVQYAHTCSALLFVYASYNRSSMQPCT